MNPDFKISTAVKYSSMSSKALDHIIEQGIKQQEQCIHTIKNCGLLVLFFSQEFGGVSFKMSPF